MKHTLLFTSLVVGLALTGCNKATRSSTAANDTSRTAATDTSAPAATATTPTDTFGSKIDSAANSASNAMSSAANTASTQARVMEWKLSGSDIQADLDAHRDIIRTRDNAPAPTGKIDKSMVKSAVESKLKADSDTAALKLDVNVKKDGEVELEGKAGSADQIGKAIACALDTDGVNKVTSKIKLAKR